MYFDSEKHSVPIESNDEIKYGLMQAIKTLVPNQDEEKKIVDQLLVYRGARGMMGTTIAIKQKKMVAPAEWWITWGSEVPELQNFAKRVLSLTVSTTPCERNWNALDNIHSKKKQT